MTDFTVTEKECGLVTSYAEWQQKQQSINKSLRFNAKECDIVTKILSLEYAHWSMRRTGGGAIDQANSDSIWEMVKQHKESYVKIMGKPYVDLNVDKTW